MSSQSSSYVLCPEAIDSENRPTLSASDAFQSQLRTLCLKEFPGGTGSWVRSTAAISVSSVTKWVGMQVYYTSPDKRTCLQWKDIQTHHKKTTKHWSLHIDVVVGISYYFQCVNFQQRKHQTSSENPLQSINHSRVPIAKLMATSETEVEAASENTRVKTYWQTTYELRSCYKFV